jgi:hypothetical protein
VRQIRKRAGTAPKSETLTKFNVAVFYQDFNDLKHDKNRAVENWLDFCLKIGYFSRNLAPSSVSGANPTTKPPLQNEKTTALRYQRHRTAIR